MNRVTSLFGIRYPIIQGGMVWCSGWRLAAAVSNAGGLGLLGAGSMHPETLREHIRKCREATHHAFGVNIPLMYPQIEDCGRRGSEDCIYICRQPEEMDWLVARAWHHGGACCFVLAFCREGRRGGC